MDCAGDNGRGRLRPARWAGEQGQLMVGFVRMQFCNFMTGCAPAMHCGAALSNKGGGKGGGGKNEREERKRKKRRYERVMTTRERERE